MDRPRRRGLLQRVDWMLESPRILSTVKTKDPCKRGWVHKGDKRQEGDCSGFAHWGSGRKEGLVGARRVNVRSKTVRRH